MNIVNSELKDINDLNGSYINKGILLCCAQKNEHNYSIVRPLVFIEDNNFYRIAENNVNMKYGPKFREYRNDTDTVFVTLENRFVENDFFYVNKFINNDNEEIDVPFFVYGNETRSFEYQVIEVYEGEFDVQQDFFIPKYNDIFELLANKSEQGARNYFYIKSAESIYGPFTTNSIEDNKIKLSSVHSNNDYIYKWDASSEDSLSILSLTTTNSSGTIINRAISSGWLPEEKSCEKFKYLSDDQLIDWIKKKIVYELQFTKKEYNNFKAILQAFRGMKTEVDESNLYNKSVRFLERSENSKAITESLLDILPQTTVIMSEIERLQHEKDAIIASKKECEKEKENILSDIQSKQSEKQDLVEDLKKRKEELDKTVDEQISAAKESNEELRASLKEEEKLAQEMHKIEKYKELKQLELKNDELRAENRVLRKDEDELKGAIKDLAQDFIEEQKSAQEKLRELVKSKTHFDFISGREFNSEKDKIIEEFCPQEIHSFRSIEVEDTSFVSHEKLLLNKVSEALKACDRTYSNDFIANVLISLFQNTMTTFAGSPGTGKTSFARILSSILVTVPQKRVEIAVAKGWTSQKDFIGFYNPLSKQFTPTNQDMYTLLKHSHNEVKESCYLDCNIGIVILDEANLSPIEHYWSSFYNLTDSVASEYSMLNVNIGTDSPLQLANNIRFISTINMDQTTEELSPRIIDRTNIIRMPNADDTLSFSFNKKESEIKSIELSFDDIIHLFDLKDFDNGHESESLDKEAYVAVRDEYIKIKEIFQTNLKISISPRIDQAFAEYCLTAIKFMPHYKALDYFISQRLLTKLEGQGESFGDSLKSLLKELENLFEGKRIDSVSIDLLNQIIETGKLDEHYHNYTYFLVK